jgi:hypothetical protein
MLFPAELAIKTKSASEVTQVRRIRNDGFQHSGLLRENCAPNCDPDLPPSSESGRAMKRYFPLSLRSRVLKLSMLRR